MHKHNENGSVATIRSIETKASSRAQHPGPSGSAVRKKQNENYYLQYGLLFSFIDYPCTKFRSNAESICNLF